MNEIPGQKTIEILHGRFVEDMKKAGFDLPKAYPVAKSFKTKQNAPIASYIDHTFLRQNGAKSDYAKLCTEALKWQVASVCLPSNRVAQAKKALEGSTVKVCTVVGFPFGYANTEAKVEEARRAIDEGASEIDMVLSVGYAKDGDWACVYQDIAKVVSACKTVPVKVILETSELSLEEKILASYAACYAGASFLKTSTGFSTSGATIEDIHLMKQIAGDKIGIKASGGIRSSDSAKSYIAAGADRLGTSSTAAILGLEEGGKSSY